MKIAIDCFGGDNAPDEAIKGAVYAHASYGYEIILVGNINIIKERLNYLALPSKGLSFEHTEDVIQISDDPMLITSSKKNCSMGRAFTLCAEGKADAAVSAGATAALVIGGTFLCKRIKGVKRPTLATAMPNSLGGHYLLADSGANSECRPEMLLQFAKMGNIYAEKIMKIKNPRVALLNIGAESEKGRELEKAAYYLLKESKLNFIGNAEGRDPTLGFCDVVVTDGFTGNVYLKAIEGMGKFMKSALTDIFTANLKSKLAYLAAKKSIKNVSKRTDYREVGGSPLLGTAVPVIKAHGSSDSLAFKNAIKRASEFVAFSVIKEIEENI